MIITGRFSQIAIFLIFVQSTQSQLFRLLSAGLGLRNPYRYSNYYRQQIGLSKINSSNPIPSQFSNLMPSGVSNLIDYANKINVASQNVNHKPRSVQIGCGKSRYSSPLVIGGDLVQRGEFPWFGSLFISEKSQLKLLCGVSLVSTKHVITAAHCIELPREPHRYTVLLGRHNIADPHEFNYQSRQVSRLKIHPEYKNRRQSADADIAVLKLKQPVQYDDFVQPVCLPKNSVNLDNVIGTVVGYGKDERNNRDHTNRPRKVPAKAVSLLKCYYSDRAYSRIASERNFCAGDFDRSPCKGDSGGGFYTQSSSGQWILNGLVSEGLIENGFCNTNKYVVYVDVASFLPWIHETVKKLSTDFCDPFPCGVNAECFEFNGSHFCACREGFRGDPIAGCKR